MMTIMTAIRNRWPFHNGSLGFLITYGIPVMLIVSIWFGMTAGYPNLSILAPMFIVWAIFPIVQSIWPRILNPVPDGICQSPGWSIYYRIIPLFIAPLQLAMLGAATAYWASGHLNIVGKLVLLLTTGIFSTFFAINAAHELIHRRQRLDRWLGGFLLSTVGYGTFKIMHLRIHHPYVGTVHDYQTARRGESLYSFWLRSLAAEVPGAIRCERERLAQRGGSWWTSELVLWYGLTAVWLMVAVAIWGFAGGFFFLMQGLIAIMGLAWMSYLQHYGLRREVGEPIRTDHAWSQGYSLQNFVVLNNLRHGDHHAHPGRPYQTLRHVSDSPQYPYNVSIMFLLSLFPSVFKRVMHSRLDQIQGIPTQTDNDPETGLSSFVRRHNLGYQIALICFARVSTLMRLTHYAVYIHPRYLPRLGLILLTAYISLPLRLLETLLYGRKIARVQIDQAPVFIIGHWRSGTTHLHNLMAQDPAFGYLSMYQAMVPRFSLIGGEWLKCLLSPLVPRKRPMDNVEYRMDVPQEEEIPLSKVTPYGFYVRFLFPQKSQMLFCKYVLFENVSPRVVREIKHQYRRLLQVATLHADGRRLLLKNPVNTARVRFLLELFPNAKFVHIHRSPYDVFASTRHLNQKTRDIMTLQRRDASKANEVVLDLYERMMKRLFEDRPQIPSGNFVEVRYEDVEQDPFRVLQQVYQALNLPGYVEAEPLFRAYVASQKNYQKNRLDLSANEKQEIEKRFAFAFETLGYPLDVKQSSSEDQNASSYVKTS